MIRYLLGIIAIILVVLIGFSMNKDKKSLTHASDVKASHTDTDGIVRQEKQQKIITKKKIVTEGKLLKTKPNKSIHEEDPETELESDSVETQPSWHLSKEEMEENEKELIEKHRKMKSSDGIVYEDDDIEGINEENTSLETSEEEASLEPSQPLSDGSLLEMEEEHLSKKVPGDTVPLEDADFNPEKH